MLRILESLLAEAALAVIGVLFRLHFKRLSVHNFYIRDFCTFHYMHSYLSVTSKCTVFLDLEPLRYSYS